MKARMKSPVMILPNLMEPLMAVAEVVKQGGVPESTLYLMHLRASQINGCARCVEMHAKELRDQGEKDARLFTVAAWRDAPHFTPQERAALALTEATTRIADRSDPVPDSVWQEVEAHYDERQRAALVLNVAMINFWNRMNVPIRLGGLHGLS